MNQIIHQLMLQAISEVYNGDDPDGDVHKMYIPNKFATRFTELIVQECERYCGHDQEGVEALKAFLGIK